MLTKQINKSEYDVVLGDVPTAIKVGGNGGKFVPNINASKWGDECWLNINHKDSVVGNEKESFVEGKTNITIGDITHSYYEDVNGMFEYELILEVIPKTNKIELELQFSVGLDMFYQDELTQQEIDDGCKRPENVIGSYAVYFNKKHNQYKTGKFGHLYRPKIIDADGDWVWGVFNKDVNESKALSITIDQTWLDNAVYPVSVDPTLGLTTDGGSIRQFNMGGGAGTVASPVTATEDGTVDDINGWFQDINSASRECKMAIYDDSSGTPNNLIDETAAFSGGITGTPTEHTGHALVGAGHTFSASDVFHLAAGSENGASEIAYDSASGTISRETTSGWPTFEDPWSEDNTATGIISVYINYTATGGGVTVPDETLAPTMQLVGSGGMIGTSCA